jgi:UDP-glucose 4-epimerase
MKKILVTGAEGFIGQHLCRYLIDAGYQVRGLRHEQRPLRFIKENEIEWIPADLRDENSIKNVAQSIDCIVHLAAIPRNDLSKNWDDFYSVNVRGTQILLDEAEKAGVKRFVFISTVEAAGYGDGVHPRKEDDTPNPENNYGKSKLEAEELVMSCKHSFERTIVRLPMIYGPGTLLIVPKLFGMVKKGFYPFIGSGETLMEFCYVGNAIAAITLAAQKDAARNNLFYVSDHRSYTIKEVVNAIAKASNKKYLPIHIPKFVAYAGAFAFEVIAKLIPVPPIISRHSRKPFFTRETVKWTTSNINFISSEKIKRELGFVPPFTIDQGCAETVKWLEENYFNSKN